jgi:hypothetical protein
MRRWRIGSTPLTRKDLAEKSGSYFEGRFPKQQQPSAKWAACQQVSSCRRFLVPPMYSSVCDVRFSGHFLRWIRELPNQRVPQDDARSGFQY